MSSNNTPAPKPHEVNTTSQHNAKTAAVAGNRTKVSGLNLPASQAISLPANQKQEILIVPSSSAPNFGSYFTIDVKNTGIIINNMYLQFQYGAVQGSSLVGAFIPSWFHISRIEILQNGNTMSTTYGNEQFLINQLLHYEEDRLSFNNAAGSYSSITNRTALSSQTTTNTFYIPLKTYLSQCKMHLLNGTDAVQIRVYMDTLANIFAVTSGTLTSCSFNSANLILDVTRLDQDETNRRTGDMQKYNHHWIFHTTSYMTSTIPAGVSSATLIMASVVGNVAGFVFVLRGSTIGLNAWNYSQIASFHLLDSGSSSIVGGQALPAALCANILNSQWCLSSFNSETSFGSVDNKANFYIYSFSSDLIDSLTHGRSLGSRRFFGNEQIQLNFNASLPANLQFDLYAFTECISEQGGFSVKKISM